MSSRGGAARPFSANRTRCGRDPPSRGGQRYPEIKQRGYYSGLSPHVLLYSL